jgi:UTP--glucose-1-phosphate uridylyltransferase
MSGTILLMKGIIVAAGYGTRFLPVTKTIPKEMLPLIDRPSIDFIVHEFIRAGVRDILIITSRRKKVLEDYFDREIELETLFEREHNDEKAAKIGPFDADFYFLRQREMRGTGHALLLAEPFIGNEPFVVAYPDDLHFGDPPLTGQLIKAYGDTGCSVMATIYNPPDINRYGVLAVAEDGLHVTDIVEKPEQGTEPSKEVSIGRYLYTPDIFAYLKEGWERHLAAHPRAEYYHTYALKQQMAAGKVVYKRTEGTRLDTGTPEGYLRAILRYAKNAPALRKVIHEELKNL